MKKLVLIEISNTASGLRYFPMAPMLLKAYAENKLGDKHTIEVKTFFDTSPRTSADVSLGSKVLAYVQRTSPDIVGFSCYLWNMDCVFNLCRSIKQHLPGIKIVLGGSEVSPESLTMGVADFAVVGEGEESIVKILEYYDGVTKIEDIPNAVYFRDGQRESNFKKETDLNDIVSPFEADRFDPSCEYYIETSRGCPYSCSYCTWNSNIKMMPEAYIDRCLQRLLGEWRVRNLFIIDSNLNMNKDHMNMVLGLLKKYNTHGADIKAEVKIDLFDDDTISKFKEAGIMRIDIGIQSVDPAVLERCNRKNDLSAIKKNITKLLSKGFIVQTHLIAGLPEDNFFKSAKSLKFLTSFSGNLIAVNPFFVLKHSPFCSRKDLCTPLVYNTSSRCAGTNSQTLTDIDRSMLFLKTYGKEYRKLQEHHIYENGIFYR